MNSSQSATHEILPLPKAMPTRPANKQKQPEKQLSPGRVLRTETERGAVRSRRWSHGRWTACMRPTDVAPVSRVAPESKCHSPADGTETWTWTHSSQGKMDKKWPMFKFYFCSPPLPQTPCSRGQNSQVPGLESQQATRSFCPFSQEGLWTGDVSGSRPCSQHGRHTGLTAGG